MKKQIKVTVESIFAAYTKGDGNVLKTFSTLENALKEKHEFLKEGILVGKVWILRTEDNEYLDDAKGCYPTREEALEHVNEIRFSHSSEPTDTEGHSYDCMHCGIHYYVFGEEDIPDCFVEKVSSL